MGLEIKLSNPTKKIKKNRRETEKQISEEIINRLFRSLELNKKGNLEAGLRAKSEKKKASIKDALKSILDYLPKKERKIKETAYQTKDLIYGEVSSTYVDYDKLYSYLGKYKSESMYENFVSPLEIDKEKDKTVEIPLEMEKIDTAVRHFKYFTPGDIMMDPALPPLGMSSEEYEKFKIWKQINYIEYWLKTKII